MGDRERWEEGVPELGRGTADDREIEGDRKEIGRARKLQGMETDRRKTTDFRSEKKVYL